jgi:hypothetical protein
VAISGHNMLSTVAIFSFRSYEAVGPEAYSGRNGHIMVVRKEILTDLRETR